MGYYVRAIVQNKNVFISGGAGVIGRELVSKLYKMGANIFVGDLEDRPVEFPDSVKYRKGDLNYITKEELDAFSPEIFFHLAATFERSEETYAHWEENFWHNIRLSNYLMTLMREISSLKRGYSTPSILVVSFVSTVDFVINISLLDMSLNATNL